MIGIYKYSRLNGNAQNADIYLVRIKMTENEIAKADRERTAKNIIKRESERARESENGLARKKDFECKHEEARYHSTEGICECAKCGKEIDADICTVTDLKLEQNYKAIADSICKDVAHCNLSTHDGWINKKRLSMDDIQRYDFDVYTLWIGNREEVNAQMKHIDKGRWIAVEDYNAKLDEIYNEFEYEWAKSRRKFIEYNNKEDFEYKQDALRTIQKVTDCYKSMTDLIEQRLKLKVVK